MYNAFDSFYYQTLKGVHCEKLEFRMYDAFDSFYYQTMKGVHFEKLDVRVCNVSDSFYYQTLKGVSTLSCEAYQNADWCTHRKTEFSIV